MKVDIGWGWVEEVGVGIGVNCVLSRIFFHNFEFRYPFFKVLYSRTSKSEA